MMKKLLTVFATSCLLMLGSAALAADATDSAPKTVIHVVTVAWKDGTTAEQIQAALNGAKALPYQYKGITRVWAHSIKVQGGKANAIAMEFADEAALKEYADSPAQKEWYKVYQPIRKESTTFDITN